jgi:hypothetical protein
MRVVYGCDIGHYRLLRWIVSIGSDESEGSNRSVIMGPQGDSRIRFMNISIARYSLRIRWRHFTVFIALEPMRKKHEMEEDDNALFLEYNDLIEPRNKGPRPTPRKSRAGCTFQVHFPYSQGCLREGAFQRSSTFVITCKNFRRSFAFSLRFLSL